MSNIEPVDSKRLIQRLLIAFVLIVAAGALGLWVGKLSVPDDLPDRAEIAMAPGRAPKQARVTEADLSAPEPPLFFYAGAGEADHWPIVLEELKFATDAEIDQIIVPLALDWEQTGDVSAVRGMLERILPVNPKARVYLHLKLDPTKAWTETRPSEALKTAPEDGPMGAPYSELWREEAARRAGALAKDIAQEKTGIHVRGYILSAMGGGRWEIPANAEAAPCALQAFRGWLKKRYVENDLLRAAWGKEDVTLENAQLPPTPGPQPAGQMFLALPGQQAVADYREFLSDSTADSIAAVMAAIKLSVPGSKVLAMYSHAFEVANGAQGMLGAGRLLYSDLDGFIGTVSSADRGIGGTGGISGPAFSAAVHQKQWIILDDTRTGVGRDAATGQIARLQGIRAEDVYNVQRRNFTLAVAHGMGLAWSDPQGEGWLHEAEQWTEIAHMREIYAQLYPPAQTDPAAGNAKGANAASSEAQDVGGSKSAVEKDAAPTAPAPADENAPEAAGAPAAPPTGSFDQQLEAMLQPAPVGPPNTFQIELMLVIDEASMNYLAAPDALRERLTLPARDAAMRSGAAVRTCLLQDLLDDIAPPAEVYLFVNAFRLNDAERERLHARLQRDQACAIWCYAPGHLAPQASTDAVSKTVGMKVATVTAPAQAGSTFTLGGRWLQEGAEIGDAAVFDPLFYIEDDEADVLAQYRGSPKGSIAIRVLPEGWTSIFVAEPAMTPGLLRELLRIIEKRSCFRLSDREHFDAAYVGLNLVGVHAKQVGEIELSLGNMYDIQDLFDPSIGWPQKESITLPVKTGETRLLKLTPLY